MAYTIHVHALKEPRAGDLAKFRDRIATWDTEKNGKLKPPREGYGVLAYLIAAGPEVVKRGIWSGDTTDPLNRLNAHACKSALEWVVTEGQTRGVHLCMTWHLGRHLRRGTMNVGQDLAERITPLWLACDVRCHQIPLAKNAARPAAIARFYQRVGQPPVFAKGAEELLIEAGLMPREKVPA